MRLWRCEGKYLVTARDGETLRPRRHLMMTNGLTRLAHQDAGEWFDFASYEHFELLRFIGYRVKTALAKGELPGGEASVMKLLVSELYERGGDLMVEVMGPAGMLTHADAPYGGRFTDLFMGQWAPRIGGGTDQVQRNIIGERVLGLPGEVRSDKSVPFRDLPRS